jgi:hypothetical protein
MVENVAEVLVKEERRLEANPTAVPPPIFLRRRPGASLFLYFWPSLTSIAK